MSTRSKRVNSKSKAKQAKQLEAKEMRQRSAHRARAVMVRWTGVAHSSTHKHTHTAVEMLRLLLLAIVVSISRAATLEQSAARMRSWMNHDVDPCDDFFQYTCGAWVANTTLPPSQPLISRTFSAVVDHNNNMSVHILTSPQFADTRMARLYRDCMDTDRIDELGISVLEDSWALFNTMTNLDHIMYVAGVLQSGGIPAFASISVVADPLHPLVSIAEFDQGGFALPDRSLYLDNSTSKLRDDYVQHMIRMFELAGVDDAEKIASEALAVEMELANAALPGDKIRNPSDLYHKIDLSGLKSLAPLLNWDIFLKGINAPAGMTQINVAEPGFFVVLNWFLPSLPVTTLRSYMMWQLLHAMAPYLGSMIVNENYRFFYAELQGQTAPTPRNVTCVNLVNQALGDELGKAFVEASFPGDSYNETVDMINQISNAFHQSLLKLDWMDQTTMRQAQLKLSQIVRHVGRPSKYNTYTGYNVNDGFFFESMLNSMIYLFTHQIARVGQPADRSVWEVSPLTVDAFYNPLINSINFPAGILQSPAFDVNFDAAANFGAIGAVMGHELTHGFDDQGRQYDGTGKLTNWWTNASLQNFQERSECMIEQYSKFEILGVPINGNRTLSENIADNGGVKMAFRAYENHLHPNSTRARAMLRRRSRMLPEFTNEQLFFLAYGQLWCEKATDDFWRLRAAADVHAPAKFRVWGPLQNFADFAEAFQCPIGSNMNPASKCQLW